MRQNPLLGTLQATAEILEQNGVGYALIGGLALMSWGAGRSTVDVDLVAVMRPSDFPALAVAFTRAKFSVGVPRVDDQVVGVRLIHEPTGVSVDLLGSVNDALVAIIGRRVHRSLGDVAVWVATAEDLIVLKLQAARPRDLDDVAALIGANRSHLDHSYLFEQAHAFDVAAQLTALLA